MKSLILTLSALITISSLQPLNLQAQGIAVVSGDKIAFLGDSITAAGKRPGGYCQLVIDGLKKDDIKAEVIFAGVSGHKSNQMLARLEKDVLSKKPEWMTLSCGVNDVWHGKRGVPLEDYKKNITKIVDQAQAASIKVMLLTSTMIKEDQANTLNQQLLPYNAFIRELATTKKCLLADLNKDMQEALKKFPKDAPKGKQLTVDGVHMNAYGNYMMASGILKAFGLPQTKISAFVEEWKKIPDSKTVNLRLKMSQYEYEKIQTKMNAPVETVLMKFMEEKKAELIAN